MAGLVPHADAHWARFYSCNVSLKRDVVPRRRRLRPRLRLLLRGPRLRVAARRAGLRLRYEPDARVAAPAPLRLARDRSRRFDGIAVGERLMAAKHPGSSRSSGLVPRRRSEPRRPGRVGRTSSTTCRRSRAARDTPAGEANTLVLPAARRPASWTGARAAEDLADLRAYLGDDFDEAKLHGHVTLGRSRGTRPRRTRQTFYRTSDAYLYDLTVFAMSGTKAPYLRGAGRRSSRRGARLLDYGCGIGTDGLRLLRRGLRGRVRRLRQPEHRVPALAARRRRASTRRSTTSTRRRARRLRPRLRLRRDRARRGPVRVPGRARGPRRRSCSSTCSSPTRRAPTCTGRCRSTRCSTTPRTAASCTTRCTTAGRTSSPTARPAPTPSTGSGRECSDGPGRPPEPVGATGRCGRRQSPAASSSAGRRSGGPKYSTIRAGHSRRPGSRAVPAG